MDNDERRVLTGIGFILMFITAAILHSVLSSVKDEVAESRYVKDGEAPEDNSFNEYGLSGDEKLSDEVLYESENYRVYSDRVLAKYLVAEDAAYNISAQVDGIRSRLDEMGRSDVNITIMPIPLRILYEDDATADTQAYNRHIGDISSVLEGKASLCNPKDSLGEQIGKKYVFYRTSESWNVVGAYYGYVDLCKAIGIKNKDLDDAPMQNQNSFYGNEYSLFLSGEADEALRDELSDMPDDPFVWLYSDTFLNREIQYDLDAQQTAVKRPVLIHSVMGSVSVVGESFDYAIADGSGENGVMLIADSAGAMLTPYLCENYDDVCVVNLSGYEDFYDDLGTLINDYNIENIVIAQLSNRLGDRAYSMAINTAE